MTNIIQSAADRFTFFNHKNQIKELGSYIENNGYPGQNVGFECLNDYYTHKTDGCTDWTGFPHSGKTYFVLETLMSLSEKYANVWLLYCPDIGSPIQIYEKLIKMRTGKDMHDKYNNKITINELNIAAKWVDEHFAIMSKKDFKSKITPIALYDYAGELKIKKPKISGLLVDSWKNLLHTYNGREDSYLDEVLSYRNEVAEQTNIHIHQITHPVKTELLDEKGDNGQKKRRVPTADDIKGGSPWYSNGKCIITVDRPSKYSSTIDILISKTKPENVGKVGFIEGKIHLDFHRGRYYEFSGIDKRFTFDVVKNHLKQPDPLSSYYDPTKESSYTQTQSKLNHDTNNTKGKQDDLFQSGSEPQLPIDGAVPF